MNIKTAQPLFLSFFSLSLSRFLCALAKLKQPLSLFFIDEPNDNNNQRRRSVVVVVVVVVVNRRP